MCTPWAVVYFGPNTFEQVIQLKNKLITLASKMNLKLEHLLAFDFIIHTSAGSSESPEARGKESHANIEKNMKYCDIISKYTHHIYMNKFRRLHMIIMII